MTTKAQYTDQVSERERRNLMLSHEAACEGIVLLENDGVLPLAPCKLALYGAGSQYTIKGGSGSGEVNVRHSVSVMEGLEAAGFEIVSKDWIDRYDAQWKAGKEQFLRGVRRKLWWPTARRIDALMGTEYRYPAGDLLTDKELAECGTDSCIYVLSRQSGEGHDQQDLPGSFWLEETEIRNILACAEHFRRFVLLINTGTPVDLSPLEGIQGIRAIVYMGQLGMEGGNAIASVLTGGHTPSGHLAVSWPKRYSDVPFGGEFAADPSHAIYKEGIYVGYRYYDSFDIEPRYPFGYGLSYTTFAIDRFSVRRQDDRILCAGRVTNTGKQYAGKQVVQLYVSCPGEDREYQRLVAFVKTKTLKPGESQTVEADFPLSVLSRYEQASARTMLDAGRYVLRAGSSSRDTEPVAVIRIEQPVVLRQHRNLCASTVPIAELTHANAPVAPDLVPEIAVPANVFTTQQIDYTPKPEILSERTRKVLKDMTVADYVKFCAGTGMMGENKGFRTPGAVGHTTADYIDRGIPNVELCDAPAGIRLERRSVQYADGSIRPVDVSISIYEYLPSWILHWFILGNPDKGKMLYQFVTAFPVPAMQAQTWNTELVERIGQAISEEMGEYGVTFWLAPGMNIVRNPLCGRNFEYYSEDPVLTGRMATAVTHGVQSVGGHYVTLKHFCANNQETKRHTISSDVDERTLREIYLPGFEMVVREAQPRAVMAAYNRLNGVYCPESRELCTDMLRAEWGFSGVVMTDWYSIMPDRADGVASIRSGVDLIMPGGEKDVKILAKACERGELSEADLRRAAARVIDALVMSRQAE